MERRRGGFEPRQNNPPINIGDELDVHIEAVGEKGDGLAKVRGFVLFVPGAKENENIKVKITRVLKKVGFAEKIGEATSNPQEQQPTRDMPKKEEEKKYEDTENFGDESSEDSQIDEESEEQLAEEE